MESFILSLPNSSSSLYRGVLYCQWSRISCKSVGYTVISTSHAKDLPSRLGGACSATRHATHGVSHLTIQSEKGARHLFYESSHPCLIVYLVVCLSWLVPTFLCLRVEPDMQGVSGIIA